VYLRAIVVEPFVDESSPHIIFRTD
jgi:hypothetical protein